MHRNQVLENEAFLRALDTHIPDRFFDWRITVMFYIALHCLRALSVHKRVTWGASHQSMFVAIDPDDSRAVMPVPRDVYAAYQQLYRNSRMVRYQGFSDYSTYLARSRSMYGRCIGLLAIVKNYVVAEGCNLS